MLHLQRLILIWLLVTWIIFLNCDMPVLKWSALINLRVCVEHKTSTTLAAARLGLARCCARAVGACRTIRHLSVFYETMYGSVITYRSSNYKRIHHFHERLSQLVLSETNIPKQDMLCIARALCANGPTTITKDSIRKVLRPLKMQRYIERWLQIIYRLTGERPPHISDLLIQQLDVLFVELQRPFDVMKQEGRKNFLNYNYVLRRLFQQVGCSKFCIFFPLIKSESKLRQLDKTWENMAKLLHWGVMPLCRSAPFEALLSDPLSALTALELSAEDSALPVLRTAQMRMECRMLDRFHAARVPLEPQLRRLDLPAQQSQKEASRRLRKQCKRAKLCR